MEIIAYTTITTITVTIITTTFIVITFTSNTTTFAKKNDPKNDWDYSHVTRGKAT